MGNRSFKRKVGIEQSADYNADKQGAVHFLGNQSQRNGYDRRNQRPESGIHGRLVRNSCFGSQRCHRKQGKERSQGCKKE